MNQAGGKPKNQNQRNKPFQKNNNQKRNQQQRRGGRGD